jgi:hypothetical protein
MIKNSILYMILLLSIMSCSKLNSRYQDISPNKKIISGVRGQVFIGPLSAQKGELNKVPYEAVLRILDNDWNQVGEIQTDEMGNFIIELNPGVYTIIPEPKSRSGSYPVSEKKFIDVKSGEIAFVEIDFDSGIR